MSLKNTRLVQILAETAPSNPKRHSQKFIDRISDIPSLHDTISLRAAHQTIKTTEFGAANIPRETAKKIKKDFVKARSLMVHSIATSFISRSRPMTNPFPTPERVYSHLGPDHPAGPLHSKVFAPFRNFYTARQNDIEAGVQRFRFQCGTVFSGLSKELASLAELDRSFGNMFSKYERNCFAAVPELLEAQFRGLFDQQEQTQSEKITVDDLKEWMGPHGWISDFCKKMREMLFAELETRLLPIQGLIESIPNGHQGS
jgi:hypothetical protein